jgi:hypothetical protein
MPRNVGNFSFVKYLYTIDSNITVKKATVPDTTPLKSPNKASVNTLAVMRLYFMVST